MAGSSRGSAILYRSANESGLGPSGGSATATAAAVSHKTTLLLLLLSRKWSVNRASFP